MNRSEVTRIMDDMSASAKAALNPESKRTSAEAVEINGYVVRLAVRYDAGTVVLNVIRSRWEVDGVRISKRALIEMLISGAR